MKSLQQSRIYLWFDMEYSTLELERAYPLQMALIATDAQLKRILPASKDIHAAVRLPDNAEPSPWVQEHLPELVKQCRSMEALLFQQADQLLSSYVAEAVGVINSVTREKPVLAGNSVHADWRLATKFFPAFSKQLHYRHLDVTALKLQWMDWFEGKEFDKDNMESIKTFFPDYDIHIDAKRHDAYYDVQASIAELNYYRAHLQVKHQGTTG